MGRLLRDCRKISANLDQFHSLVLITFSLLVHREAKWHHGFVEIHSEHRLQEVLVGSKAVAGDGLRDDRCEKALLVPQTSEPGNS